MSKFCGLGHRIWWVWSLFYAASTARYAPRWHTWRFSPQPTATIIILVPASFTSFAISLPHWSHPTAKIRSQKWLPSFHHSWWLSLSRGPPGPLKTLTSPTSPKVTITLLHTVTTLISPRSRRLHCLYRTVAAVFVIECLLSTVRPRFHCFDLFSTVFNFLLLSKSVPPPTPLRPLLLSVIPLLSFDHYEYIN